MVMMIFVHAAFGRRKRASSAATPSASRSRVEGVDIGDHSGKTLFCPGVLFNARGDYVFVIFVERDVSLALLRI